MRVEYEASARGWTRYKLWLIRRLLWRADAVICSLPPAREPRGAYYDLHGALLDVHGAIGKAYDIARDDASSDDRQAGKGRTP